MTDTVHVFDTAASDYGPVPANAEAVAPYMDARYRNVDAARRRFPHLFAAGMVATITALRGDADIVDWEPGNLDPPPAQWYEQQKRAGRWRPGFYEDLSDGRITVLPALVAHLGGLGPPGASRPVRIFTAHPTGTPHLCGPHTCGQFPVDADATQYWWTSIQGRFPGAGGDVDVSLARRDFFPVRIGQPGGRPQPSKRKDQNMIAAVVKQDGRLEVFVEKGNGEVFHAYQAETNGGWAGAKQGVRTVEWYSLGTPGASSAGAASVEAPAGGAPTAANVAADPVSPAPAPAPDQPVPQPPAAGETPGPQQGP